MPEQPQRVALGKLGRPHGVRGEIRLFLFNPESQTLVSGLDAYVRHEGRSAVPVEIEKARYAAKFVIVKFAGIDDRDEVDKFKHAHLEVSYEDLPELDEEAFYYVELVGSPVYVAAEEYGDIDDDAEPIGEVDRFFETGANDVLVVNRDGDQLLVPMVEHAVSLLDLERSLVILQPLETWTAPEDDEE